MAIKQETLKANSAVFKAEFTKYRDLVRDENKIVILQCNNKDQVAMIPLAMLEKVNGKKESA